MAQATAAARSQGKAQDTEQQAPAAEKAGAGLAGVGNAARAAALGGPPAGGGAGGGGGAGAPAGGAPPAGGGSPVPMGIRQRFESATGQSLADVRVHTGPEAQAFVRSRGAEALTIGQNIYFSSPVGDSQSPDALHLWGHELAHTLHAGAGRGAAGGGSGRVEAEAEAFGAAFATGTAGGQQRISRGAGGGAAMQRGGGEAGPTVEELAAPVRARLVEARARGQEALLAEVRSLRGQASGDALTAINLAVEQTLTDAELAALSGGGPAPAAPTAAADPQAPAAAPPGGPPAAPTGGPPAGPAVPGGPQAPAAGPQAGGPQAAGADQTQGGPTAGPAAGPTAGPTAPEGATGGEQADGEATVEQASEEAAAGPEAAPEQAAGAGGGGGAPAAAPAGPTPAQAMTALAALPEGDRAFIKQELDFHGSWQAMQGGAGSRAGQMASGLGGDILGGAKGAIIQTVAGQAVGALATRIPVPGLGNMLGGAFSAYALFSNGGAGISKMAGDIQNGFSFEGKGGWQAAADLIAGVKSILDLVGNICNILSGLAYAFAAIAAVGGLLSVFFPPLAFLVPYIPTAINFGRACGGIASVCLGVSNLISPIPPVLRAIHIMVSDDDPLALATQEARFHEELTGAIANYGNAAMDRGLDTGGGNFNPLTQFKGGIAGGASATRSAGADLAGGNRQAVEAFGFQGQGAGMRTGGNGQANGRSYFDTAGNSTRAAGQQTHHQDLADSRAARAKELQAEADGMKPAAGAPRRERRAHTRVQNRAEQKRAESRSSQGQADAAEYRGNVARGLHKGGAQGEGGNTFDSALGAATADPEREAAPVEITRNERGHVVLPPPPGTLGEVDALADQITALQAQLQAQQAEAAQAAAVEAQASQQGELLQCVADGVGAHGEQHAALDAERQAALQQQSQIRTQTEQAQGGAGGGMSQAADTMRPWVGPAQTVNSIVQRVPSNRFFNVSGTQQNLQSFVTGMEQFTGTGDQQAETQGQTEQALAARDAQLEQAVATHGQVQADTTSLTSQVTADRATATAVAGEAAAAEQAAATQAQTLEQQIEAARAQREARFNGLVGWANQHYNVRSTAMRPRR